jgi:hypothetical protein
MIIGISLRRMRIEKNSLTIRICSKALEKILEDLVQ